MSAGEFLARLVLVLEGCFVLGVSVIAIRLYWRNPLIGHISAIATSYVLLIGAVTHSLYYEAYPRLSGKGAIVFIAYALGDYALLRILIRHRNGTSGELPPEHWQKRFDEIQESIAGLRRDLKV